MRFMVFGYEEEEREDGRVGDEEEMCTDLCYLHFRSPDIHTDFYGVA